MIVHRIVWGIKKGYGQKAADILRDTVTLEKELGGYSGPSRIYLRETDEGDYISLEQEYPDVNACKKDMSEWRSRPSTEEFMKQWHVLREGSESWEFWTMFD